jgi:DNA-binding transcriptional ArsR family regulator
MYIEIYLNTIMNNITKDKIEELRKLLVASRIKILGILYSKDTCVCQMVEKLEMKHNLISHHLKTLTDMGYLESTRNGQHIMYKLVKSKKPLVADLFKIIMNQNENS